MKILTALIVFFLINISIQSQINKKEKLHGFWIGDLRVSSNNLRIVFEVSVDSLSEHKTLMGSPDQGVMDIPVDETIVRNDSVFFKIKMLGEYIGVIKDSLILGIWRQAGTENELNLKKSNTSIKINRSQTPVRPYPYIEEEFYFENKRAGVFLHAALFLPDTINQFPAVVFISGSGPQDKDETIFNHRPFLVIADYLARRGIASLRFDDRGAGKSTGDFSKATSFDFADDVISAVEYLLSRKEIDRNKIGALGHSEGGLIAPYAAFNCEDISFLALLAAPGLPGKDIMLIQTELILADINIDKSIIDSYKLFLEDIYNAVADNMDDEIIRNLIKLSYNKHIFLLEDSVKKFLGLEEFSLAKLYEAVNSPWMKNFIKYDPRLALEQTIIPVLAINGEKDLQISPNENLMEIEKALIKAGNKNYKIKKIEGVNHLFQTCDRGSISEYGKIEETISSKVLEIIGNWIVETVRQSQ